MSVAPIAQELLSIKDLHVEYRSGGTVAKAVNALNLTINRGEAVGLVGETGAGKTTTALAALGLLPAKVGHVTNGDIFFHGESLLSKTDRELAQIRGAKISMIFQNPLSALNPLFTIGHQVTMALRKHQRISSKQARAEAGRLLRLVGIPDYRADDYPHQFSGGMRQRVGIAAAVACSPELLIADEPTTALDVTIQAQILELMKELQARSATSLLMITHNLGIISELCDKVAIMYGGEVVEFGPVSEVFTHPRHWYTVGLLNALPKLEGGRERLVSIPGSVANAESLPTGCKFHPRCPHRIETCADVLPVLNPVTAGHEVACWNMEGS